MNPAIDLYLTNGCGRCKYYKTPDCKVHSWVAELQMLRSIVLECGLTEELKWSMPVYTSKGKNIVMVAAFKEYCAISFFKGALLKDPRKLVEKQGENSRSARIIKFTDLPAILSCKTALKKYIVEAIAIEESGDKMLPASKHDPMPEEFQQQMVKDKALKDAFFALTPGRQRAYLLFFSQPVKSETRIKRITDKRQDILKGIGMNDR